MYQIIGAILIACGASLAVIGTGVLGTSLELVRPFVVAICSALNLAIGSALLFISRKPSEPEPETETVVPGEWRESEVSSEKYQAREKIDIVTTKNGTSFVQRLKLFSKSNGALAAEFAIIKVYDRAHWGFDAAEQLYARPRKRVDLERELDSAHIRGLLEEVRSILCLGLVSSAETHGVDALSINRAARLKHWLLYSKQMIERQVQVHAVPMGQARTKYEKGSLDEMAQRSAVLIGINFDNDLIDEERALNELSSRAHLEIVRLNDYPNGLRPVE